MKLANIILTSTVNSEKHVAALAKSGIIDITALGFPDSTDAIIAAGDDTLHAIEGALRSYNGALLAPDEFTFSNVTTPKRIVCEGLNYTDHAEETGGEAPKYPVFFSKFNDTLVPTATPVVLPAWQRCYDYEAELVIVIGRAAYNISKENAEDYIFGYTIGNDLSARDAQFLSTQWLPGKSFPGFAPAGPWITTRDELNPEIGVGIRCFVNGEPVQNGNTSNMIYSCRQTVAAASRYFALEPGDLIFTGTPAGVILGKPKGQRVWLKPGDTVTVEIDGIGELVTPLV